LQRCSSVPNFGNTGGLQLWRNIMLRGIQQQQQQQLPQG
jgi:hypothetical protein